MTPPFDVAIETVKGDPASLELRVQWQKDVMLSSPFSVPRLVESFVSLGASGGFAGRAYPPFQSSMHLLSRTIADDTGHAQIAMTNCDPGAAAVLRDIVVFSHLNVAPLKRAVVRAALPSGARIKGIPVGYFEPLPFPCEIAPEFDEIHICVQFAAPPSEDGMRQVDEILTAWSYVVAAGAFSPQTEDKTRPFLVPEEDPDWAIDEVWLRVADARFDEVAFDALLNALHSAHARIAPIVRVGVE